MRYLYVQNDICDCSTHKANDCVAMKNQDKLWNFKKYFSHYSTMGKK